MRFTFLVILLLLILASFNFIIIPELHTHGYSYTFGWVLCLITVILYFLLASILCFVDNMHDEYLERYMEKNK